MAQQVIPFDLTLACRLSGDGLGSRSDIPFGLAVKACECRERFGSVMFDGQGS